MRKYKLRLVVSLAGTVAICFLVGCASTAPRSSPPAGASYHQDKDLQNVWLGNHFDFTGYDTLYIAETRAELAKTNDLEEAEMLAWAKDDLRSEFAQMIGRKQVFKLVTTDKSKILPDQKSLALENTIIEYAKGSGAARFWAGEFGAGQPVIRVRGEMTDGTNIVFMFESYRSGDSAAARLDPGWTAEKSLQTTDIHDLGVDLADFIDQTAKHQSRE